MAILYLIDGYNLLYALPEMPAGSWQQKREHLLVLLKQRRPQGNNPITVVFDSRDGMGDQMQEKDLTVIFTAGETADDRISAMVRKAPNPRILVVVSNDLGIRTLVRGTGAKFLSATDFLKAAPTPAKPNRTSRSSEQAEEITEEFKKKWL